MELDRGRDHKGPMPRQIGRQCRREEHITMNAPDLLAELAQRAKIAGLAFNAAGRARIQVEDELALELEHDSAANHLHAYAVVGYAKGAHREELYAHLLTMNLFCRQTLGATLALDPATGELLLCRALDLTVVDYPAFERALDDLATAAAAIGADLATRLDRSEPPEKTFSPLETGVWLRA
jgi:hypothetical protein